MSEFHLGSALLFVIPGLLAYCAFYGIFGGGKKVSVAPPPANSIEALTIILLASLFAHAVTAGLAVADEAMCRTGRCLGLSEMIAFALRSTRGGDVDPTGAKSLLLLALLEGGGTYLAVRLWLGRLTRRDRLPSWLYGWTAGLANVLDNPDRVVIAYVLTNQDVDGRSIVYAGAVLDMAITRDGSVARITLEDCERYLVAMDKPLSSGEPLSHFELMTIDRGGIRNVAFELFILADPALPPAIAA